MESPPVAGVDVSKRFSDICILAPNNTVFERVKVFHDLESMTFGLQSLLRAEKEYGMKPVVVMESTSHYHRILWQFLRNQGFEVIVINPIQSGALKNIYVRKVKNDKVDAYKIATLYRLKSLRPSNIPMHTIGALRALARQHHEIKCDITRYTNRLTAILDQFFPGYDKIFSEITAKGSMAVLERWPTPEDILSAGESELIDTICRESKHGVKFASNKTQKLIAAAKKATHLGFHQSSDSILARSFVSTLRLLFANVQAIDDEMRRVVVGDFQINTNVELLTTIPGIGEYSAIVLLAEIGDFSAFKKPKQLTAFFGLDPSERQSGMFRGTKNKISKRGTRYVRAILNMAAHNCTHKTGTGKQPTNPVLAQYYEKKLESKHPKVAMCAVMHKIVNIVFAVLRDQKPFELRLPEDHAQRLLQAAA